MTPEEKIKYIKAYIHYMKGKRVEIFLPQNVHHSMLMNQAYMYALSNMNRMGKKLHV